MNGNCNKKCPYAKPISQFLIFPNFAIFLIILFAVACIYKPKGTPNPKVLIWVTSSSLGSLIIKVPERAMRKKAQIVEINNMLFKIHEESKSDKEKDKKSKVQNRNYYRTCPACRINILMQIVVCIFYNIYLSIITKQASKTDEMLHKGAP